MRFRSLFIGAVASSSLLLGAGASAGAAIAASGHPASNRAVPLTAWMPLRNVAELNQLVALQANPQSPMYHHWLSAAQFRTAFGATPATVRATVSALQRHGFTVTSVDTQHVRFTASVTSLERTFGTKMRFSRFAATANRARIVASGAVRLPADLAVTGMKILGLGDTPAPKPGTKLQPDSRLGAAGPYWFDDLKQAYQYPINAQANGTGVTIAIVGYGDYSQADATQYFNNERVGGAHSLANPPTIEPLYAGQTTPQPFDISNDDDVEADIDVQQAGGGALGATVLSIKDTGYPPFMGGIDQVTEASPPLASIVSISYLLCEGIQLPPVGSSYNTDQLDAYHSEFVQGNSEGITFVAASGDNGGAPCGPPAAYTGSGGTYAPVPGVSSYANDPSVTGVGGTNLQTTTVSGKLNSAYVSESEYATQFNSPQPTFGNSYLSPFYFGSGGGVSAYFAEPDYQKTYGIKASGREVPDVSMHMGGCPHSEPSTCAGNESADEQILAGAVRRVLGTSLSAPEFAGLLAIKEGALGSALGNENYDLYALGTKQRTTHYFHDGIPGNNGVIGDTDANGNVKYGYNTIVGLGTPIAITFVNDPSTVFDAAGTPQTPGNP